MFVLEKIKMMKAKKKSVTVLTKGIEFLFKKNKVHYIKGKGVIFSKNDIVVYENNKKTNYDEKTTLNFNLFSNF